MQIGSLFGESKCPAARQNHRGLAPAPGGRAFAMKHLAAPLRMKDMTRKLGQLIHGDEIHRFQLRDKEWKD
jgi:hypothetical protein